MSIIDIDKKSCTGCVACANKCPIGCIKMTENQEGFLYPHVEGECTNCNACIEVCPVINYFNSPPMCKKVACGLHKDNDIWARSSSGGAFSAVCDVWGDEKTIVFGAKFNEQSQVVHDHVIGVSNIEPFRKSKYVQSKISESYKTIKELLNSGNKVIFSGSPCQVAGLYNFLDADSRKSLLMIDFICHGVGSPRVFADYIFAMGKKHKSVVQNITFRNKKIKWGVIQEYIVKINFIDGRSYKSNNDLYNSAFLSKLICRESCDNCAFANKQRASDLTLADFKALYDTYPNIKSLKNRSIIIAHSEKGSKVLSHLNDYMELISCNSDTIDKECLRLERCIRNPDRQKFFMDYREGLDIFKCLSKYQNKNILAIIWRTTPIKMRAWMKRELKR